MKVYLVGGAVRDELLGLESGERDWVVVGSTPDEMLKAGYKPVGRNFPVFLHPDTREEYALARTERKTAPGYHGFSFHASPEVTLEQDLERRDLTVNAMARDDSGAIIDPFVGRNDLSGKLLRHVSPAFAEDPVRILRLARFRSRFHELGFEIAAETRDLMNKMVQDGEVDALVPERVWQETVRALGEKHPRLFFEVLHECGAMKAIFPELDALFGVPQPEKYHPEVDTGLHTLMTLDVAARLTDDVAVRFAALTHDLGKAETPAVQLPGHRGHEKRGVRLVRAMAQRLGIPRDFRELAIRVAEFHCHCHRAQELKPATMLKVIEAVDAIRNPDRFERFLQACEADARGRKGLESNPYPQAILFRRAHAAALTVSADDVEDKNLTGQKLGNRIRQLRVKAIAAEVKSEK